MKVELKIVGQSRKTYLLKNYFEKQQQIKILLNKIDRIHNLTRSYEYKFIMKLGLGFEM